MPQIMFLAQEAGAVAFGSRTLGDPLQGTCTSQQGAATTRRTGLNFRRDALGPWSAFVSDVFAANLRQLSGPSDLFVRAMQLLAGW